jgi:hypothetical protein
VSFVWSWRRARSRHVDLCGVLQSVESCIEVFLSSVLSVLFSMCASASVGVGVFPFLVFL